MRRVLINYADRRFYRAQRVNAWSGLHRGGFDQAFCFRRSDLDAAFVERNHLILDQSRGAGLWLWKPYIIRAALKAHEDGDIIVYCDSGAKFLIPIDELAKICADRTPGVLARDLGVHLERTWTKRDAFVFLDCDTPDYHDSPQLASGLAVFRNGAFAREFVAAWLDKAQDLRLISDLPLVGGKPNFPDFQAHRHDQSILSLLYKRHRLLSYQQITGLDGPKVIEETRRDPSRLTTLAAATSALWHGHHRRVQFWGAAHPCVRSDRP